ncbi:MAG: hypothetical protein ACOC93_02175 [Planctomycetota bacterium]
MTRPSPIHRDPEEDGADYGCFSDEANTAVSQGVEQIAAQIDGGEITDGDSVIHAMQDLLTPWRREGATDTVVKENVAQALAPHVESAGIEIDQMAIYGW